MGDESNEDISIHKTNVCALMCTCHMYHEHYFIRNANQLNILMVIHNVTVWCMLWCVVVSFHYILSYYNA